MLSRFFHPDKPVNKYLVYFLMAFTVLITSVSIYYLSLKKPYDFSTRFNAAKDYYHGYNANETQLPQENLLRYKLPEPKVNPNWGSEDHKRPPSLPHQILCYAPFLNYQQAKTLFFIVNGIVLFCLPILLIKKTNFFGDINLKAPRNKDLFLVFLALLLLNSSAVVFSMRMGQLIIVQVFCLYYAFFVSKSRWSKAPLIAFSTIIKYSNLPLFYLWLAIKKDFKTIFASLGLIALANAVPILWHDYTFQGVFFPYVESILNIYFIPGGVSEVNINPFYLIGVGEVFQHAGVARILKLALAAIMVHTLYKEYKNPSDKITIDGFFNLSMVTILIIYHRLYEALFILPILCVYLYNAYLNGKWKPFFVYGFFLSLLVIPFSIFFAASPYVFVPFFQFLNIDSLFYLHEAIAPQIADKVFSKGFSLGDFLRYSFGLIFGYPTTHYFMPIYSVFLLVVFSGTLYLRRGR